MIRVANFLSQSVWKAAFIRRIESLCKKTGDGFSRRPDRHHCWRPHQHPRDYQPHQSGDRRIKNSAPRMRFSGIILIKE